MTIQTFSRALLGVLAALPSLALASSTAYTDRQAWSAAVGTTTDIDFSTGDNGSPLTSPPSDTVFPSLSISGATFQNVHSVNNQFLEVEPGQSFRVTLPPNTFSVGTDLGAFIGANYQITLSTGETFSRPASGYVFAGEFFGVLSTTPIQWINISIDNNFFFIMDNFSFKVIDVLPMSVDVLPGSDKNKVNVGSNGMVQVAILSSASLDARTVTPTSAKFGPTGTEASALSSQVLDVNGDGLPDLVLRFRITDTQLGCGDSRAVMKASTQLGQLLEGSDFVVSKECK